ncbi:MAG: GatB/YqeY domain-containing protein [Candidatus Sericytochromatia bacterium]
MLKDQISKDLAESMKAKDEKRTLAIRNIRTKVIELEKRDTTKPVNDADIISVLTKLAKERKQSIEMFEQGGRPELAEAEKFELGVIESYLPKQMSVEEIEAKVKEIITENSFASVKDMGKAIKVFNEKYSGMADGKTVSELVKKNLG